MGQFFWEFQDYNDLGREWLCFALNAFVFAFTFLTMVRTWLFYRKLVFEVIPLTFNVVSTLALLLLKLFEKGYEFDLIGYLIEIFTYFLFAFTFALILSKTKSSHHPSIRIKVYVVAFILIVAILIVFIFLVAFKIVERNCDQNLVIISIITLSCEVITYVPALYYAKRIIHLLNRKKHTSLTQTMLSQQTSIRKSLSDQFTIERKKQIFAVLLIYTLSLLIRITLLIITLSIQGSDLIKCENLQGMMIITSDYTMGQIVLILIQINQLLPHIIIPIALFIIPMKSKYKTQGLIVVDIGLSQNKQDEFIQNSDEDDTLDSKDQIIRSKVSSLISDKRSQTSSLISDKRSQTSVISNKSRGSSVISDKLDSPLK